MPLCDSQLIIVLLIVLLIYTMNPIDSHAEKTYGRRPPVIFINDGFLLFLLALGMMVLIQNVRCHHAIALCQYSVKHDMLKSNCALGLTCIGQGMGGSFERYDITSFQDFGNALQLISR